MSVETHFEDPNANDRCRCCARRDAVIEDDRGRALCAVCAISAELER